MNIRSVSAVNFKGKIGTTDEGNEYEKSNAGKKFCTLMMPVGSGITLASLKNVPKTPGIIAWNLTRALVIGLGIGALIDVFTNSTRRKDTDKFVEKGKKSKDTNKGKMIFGGIGLGIGALVAFGISNLNKILPQQQKISPVVVPALCVLEWLVMGTIYDHSVNKFRAKLAQKPKEEVSTTK